MSPAIYPLIGLLTGMAGGWFWQNLKPGVIAAIATALLAGLFSNALDGLGALTIGLGVTLAAMVSFFGTVAGTRLRKFFERKAK